MPRVKRNRPRNRFPVWLRILLPLVALFYTLSPYDLLPDFLLGPGWLDDAALLVLLWWFWSRKSREAGRGPGSTGAGKKARSEDPGRRTRPGNPGEESPRDPYAVLGIPRNASSQEIRRAYREQVNRYHPDKVTHLGDEFVKLAEQRFKEIQQAYKELMP